MKVFDVVELQDKEKAIIKEIRENKVLVEVLNNDKSKNTSVEIEKEKINKVIFTHKNSK